MLTRVRRALSMFGTNLCRAWGERPIGVTITVGVIYLGVHAAIRGENVSKAFDTIGGGFSVRLMGALLILGGVMCAISIYQDDAFQEVLGLGFTLVGTLIYVIGAYWGLGEQGSMSGGMYLLVTLGCIGRIWVVMRRARARARQME